MNDHAMDMTRHDIEMNISNVGGVTVYESSCHVCAALCPNNDEINRQIRNSKWDEMMEGERYPLGNPLSATVYRGRGRDTR